MNVTPVVPFQSSKWNFAIKRKINRQEKKAAGFSNASILVIILASLACAFYVYSINAGAAKGYQIRQVEKEIGDLQKENEKLKIKEAQLKSLQHIEETSRNLNMADLKNVSYIEETGPVALK